MHSLQVAQPAILLRIHPLRLLVQHLRSSSRQLVSFRVTSDLPLVPSELKGEKWGRIENAFHSCEHEENDNSGGCRCGYAGTPGLADSTPSLGHEARNSNAMFLIGGEVRLTGQKSLLCLFRLSKCPPLTGLQSSVRGIHLSSVGAGDVCLESGDIIDGPAKVPADRRSPVPDKELKDRPPFIVIL